MGTSAGGLNVQWRADVGGINNRTPFVTKTHVYAAGDDSGVICVERKDGHVIWKSDVHCRPHYRRERRVRLHSRSPGAVPGLRREAPTDAAREISVPLGSANFSDVRHQHREHRESDRVYLAADNGLIVCLRDSAKKYAKPHGYLAAGGSKPAQEDRRGGSGARIQEPKKEPEQKKRARGKKEQERGTERRIRNQRNRKRENANEAGHRPARFLSPLAARTG